VGALDARRPQELAPARPHRHRRRAQSSNLGSLAFRTLRDSGREARRLLDDLR
jgi:hypothetical protein